MLFVVGNTGTTDPVTGTSFFCTGTIDGVMWTMGHQVILLQAARIVSYSQRGHALVSCH